MGFAGICSYNCYRVPRKQLKACDYGTKSSSSGLAEGSNWNTIFPVPGHSTASCYCQSTNNLIAIQLCNMNMCTAHLYVSNCGFPLGPSNSPSSASKSQKTTSPAGVCSLLAVKSIKLTTAPSVRTLRVHPRYLKHNQGGTPLLLELQQPQWHHCFTRGHVYRLQG